MTPEQGKQLVVGMSVVVPRPLFAVSEMPGVKLARIGDTLVRALVGRRYLCKPIGDGDTRGRVKLTPSDMPPVDGYGLFWAEWYDGVNVQPQRILAHVSQAYMGDASFGAAAVPPSGTAKGVHFVSGEAGAV